MEIGYQEVALIVTGIYTLASIIIRLTPTEKDDKVLAQSKKALPRWLRIVEIVMLSTKKKKDR